MSFFKLSTVFTLIQFTIDLEAILYAQLVFPNSEYMPPSKLRAAPARNANKREITHYMILLFLKILIRTMQI
jgi:hypothetical protein